VTILRVDGEASLLHLDDDTFPCTLGKGGLRDAVDKREGDGCTPIGRWPIQAALLRPDSGFAPPPHLPWRWLRRQDGWSDDVADPAYNRPVLHPHAHSAERLWREDGVYDVILVLGHNASPPIPGKGSAIFLHLRGEKATEGCVAIDRTAMALLLARLKPGDSLDIQHHLS
jgi:L,D-peptidoglycan transpeptidase YkuD (ErfK/YbiS/YcfS/YnhG family)